MEKKKKELNKTNKKQLKDYLGFGAAIPKENWTLLLAQEGLIIFQNEDTGMLYYVKVYIDGFSLRHLAVDPR